MVANREEIIAALEKCAEQKEDYKKVKEQNRTGRLMILNLLESSGKTNWTKDKIREALLEIARELK